MFVIGTLEDALNKFFLYENASQTRIRYIIASALKTQQYNSLDTETKAIEKLALWDARNIVNKAS